MAKQPKLGSGLRFKKLANKFAHKGIDNPGALAASIGRKKYSNERFQKMATAGKKRHAKARHEHSESGHHSY
jgi:hypothetical protein